MLIRELPSSECYRLISGTHFGKLGCAKENQPYVLPFYFAYHERYFYSFSTIGRKVEWMRTNHRVCVEIDEINSLQCWWSIVILGQYEEIHEHEEKLRQLASQLLNQHPQGWEPAYATTRMAASERPLVIVYFRISIDEMTGHIASNGQE